MQKPISRKQHGFTDYSYVPLVLASPALAGFDDDPTPTTLARIMAGSILASSLFTRTEWGVFRKIPFKMHLTADVTAGVLALSAPWLFGFSKNERARNTFIAAGVFGILAGTLSQPNEMAFAE